MDAGALVTVGGSYDHEQARRMAVHAGDILESCERTETLQEALRGCGRVIGTTARRGPYRHRVADIRDLVRECIAGAARDDLPVAFVFGPEDRGLSNREVALCHRLVRIPSSAAYSSLNLAQSVMICLYEFRRARLEYEHSVDAGRRVRAAGAVTPAADAGAATPVAGAGAVTPAADAADLEAAYVALEEALLAIGFLSEDNPGHMMATIRGLLGRAVPDPREVRVVRGLARQILWFAGEGRAIARNKHEQGKKLR